MQCFMTIHADLDARIIYFVFDGEGYSIAGSLFVIITHPLQSVFV